MPAKPVTATFERNSGFGFLVGKFSELEVTPALHDICGWLAEAEIFDDELIPYRHFSEEKYTRTRIFRNQFVEMLVLGWTPGQKSLIHDHDRSVGAVRVAEGTVTETKYRWDDDGYLAVALKSSVGKGQIAGVGEPDIHLLENSGAEGEYALTIHVYAPPLDGLNIYDLETREIDFILLD